MVCRAFTFTLFLWFMPRQEPYITSLSPYFGPVTGGTRISIHGGYFGDFEDSGEPSLVPSNITVRFDDAGIFVQHAFFPSSMLITYVYSCE